ncbi:MAG: 30S ribosomal protein S1, partial [Acidobacteria bacterium]
GRVIAISAGGVIVDVGFKSEGVIPTEQFLDEQGRCTVKEGDQIDVFLEQTEDANGHVVLSREKAERMKIWDVIERAYREGTVVKGRVIERIKGGLAVDIGVRAFLPGSQIDLRPVRNLDSLRGEEFEMRVIKVNKKRGNIVLSRKAVLEEAMQEEKAKTMEVLEDGKVMEGVVKNITDYGAFIDLGGVDGLLHITDMSWGRVNHPSELFNVGDKIKVKVIKFNREDGRVSLGYKQLSEDPWLHADMRYPKNLRVQGKVVSLTDYGAFVELEPGIEGLIHISEMTWNKRVKHPSKIVSVNEMVDVVILDIDTEARRISLGLKQTEPNPWDVMESRYTPGTVITGKVRNVTDFGVFVEVEDGIDGLVHITDMSWGRVNHPSELFNVGDKIKVKVIKFNREDGRVSLGYKQLSEDPWLHADMRYPKNLRVQGKVVSLTDYGAFVELEPGIEGLIHISEMTWNKRVKHPSKIVSVNEMVDVVILDIDTEARRISLGLKQTEPNPWDVMESRYTPGTVITGKVRNVTDFGVFVEVEEGIDGLVHVSDMSWTKRVKHPSELFKKGDEVQAVILSIDAANQKLSLGIKQLEPDRWEDWFSRHNVGDVVRGNVVRITNFGAFVELADGIEGLCHVSELDEKHVDKPAEFLAAGQEVEMKIIKLNLQEKKIGLSLKAMKEEEPRVEFTSYIASADSGSASMGDRLGDQLREISRFKKNESE